MRRGRLSSAPFSLPEERLCGRSGAELAVRALFRYIMCVRNKAMKTLHLTLAAGAGLAVALAFGALGAFAPAEAQQQGAKQAAAKTPDSFPYELVNGKRVPRGKRVAAADGSWREEIKDGPCATVKEKTASGEYREVRKCD
jgi:hypothetical protein